MSAAQTWFMWRMDPASTLEKALERAEARLGRRPNRAMVNRKIAPETLRQIQALIPQVDLATNMLAGEIWLTCDTPDTARQLNRLPHELVRDL